jgi:glycosyltransferase involved in cell wall biosynthesis
MRTSNRSRPLVALIGGPDVDARLPLMQQLAGDFEVCAFGSAPPSKAFEASGFHHRQYPLKRRVAPLADLRTLGFLTAAFTGLAPDLVHAFDTKPGVFASIAARRARVPVVIATVTGLGSLYASDGLRTRVLRRIHGWLQRKAARCADLTIFQNHDDAQQLARAGIVDPARSAVVLGSGVATSAFDPALVPAAARAQVRSELGLPADAVVATMIARVTRSKGIPEFAQVARTVGARLPTARFLLVGPDDRDSIDRLPERELTELRTAVIWPGARRDVAAVLAASDLFVLPTAYREGIPRVLLEAASMALPLVTTDSPGCNEICAHRRNGILVRLGDAAGLAAAVEELIAQPDLRSAMGRESRRRAVADFDLGVIAAQTRAIYQRLLADAAVRARAAARDPR